MGAPPKISLLKMNPGTTYECQICGEKTRKNKFLWRSWFTGIKINICRDCAYKEVFGTKNIKKAKAKGLLEKKSTNKKGN
tara:strand:+ start:290 stop:529 length:240 start_codon:yes stop_codon:yes gene_type:complete